MNNKSLFLIFLFFILVILSCNSKDNNSGNKKIVDKVHNKRIQVTKNQMNVLSQAIGLFYEFNGYFPEKLNALVEEQFIPVNIAEQAFYDGWGNEIIYVVDESLKKVSILSYGSDGIVGGEGTAEDIEIEVHY